ncbi:MAG: beta-ketoacyl synthase chain length factor [Lautropia sp.]|nr:beta-ketoacyl synthase chain length factor [Lautropia sp.]
MFQFSIKGWRIVSNRMATDEQWRAWARGEISPDSLPEFRPELGWLPAMQRRRLNTPARLMMDAMSPLLAEGEHLPVVYSSHDGEINRSLALWLSLMRGEGVSPTSFGLSVHNALVGQWSMLRQDMSESSAICVREEGLEAAFAEAVPMFDEGVEQVMVVVTDDPAAAEHRLPVLRAPLSYALAFVLVPGTDWQLSCIHHALPGRSPAQGVTLSVAPAAHLASPASGADQLGPYWGALDWVKQMLIGADDFTLHYSLRDWRWQRLR